MLFCWRNLGSVRHYVQEAEMTFKKHVGPNNTIKSSSMTIPVCFHQDDTGIQTLLWIQSRHSRQQAIFDAIFLVLYYVCIWLRFSSAHISLVGFLFTMFRVSRGPFNVVFIAKGASLRLSSPFVSLLHNVPLHCWKFLSAYFRPCFMCVLGTCKV